MFVRALGSGWAGLVAVPVTPADPAVDEWLRGLRSAGPGEVLKAVTAAADQQVTAAIVTLLARARRAAASTAGSDPQPALDGAGQLLRLIVAYGHGTDFSGGRLAQAHARFLVGLEHHLTAPWQAHRAYTLAMLAYQSEGAQALALLASLASTTVEHRVRTEGDFVRAWQQLDLLAGVEPALAAALDTAIRPYLAAFSVIAAVHAGRADDDCTLAGLDAESAVMLSTAAIAALDTPSLAARLARLSDAVHTTPGVEVSGRELLAMRLLERRLWSAAADLLAELHAARPDDGGLVTQLARAYAELGRWPEGEALLVATLSDPASRDDLPALDDLYKLSVLAGDPDAERWRELMCRLDPDADPLRGMPKAPGHTEPPRRYAAFRDGELRVAPELAELSEEEQQAHLMAAIVSGRPDGGDLLARLMHDDPPLADQVATVLGIRRMTRQEAAAEEHYQIAEQHFAAGRFAQAQHDYQAALRLDPQHAKAAMYLGDTFYRRGQYHLAQAYVEESLAIEPSAQAYRFLGDAIRLGGHGARRAKACYVQALRLDPTYRGAREALARLGPDEPPQPSVLEMPGTAPAPDILPAAAPDSLAATGGEPADATGVGDRLLAAVRERMGPDSVVGVADDDELFARWLAGADPDDIVRAIMTAISIGFQYHMKDRDVPRWKHWVMRHHQLAQALPDDYGPARSIMGLGRDRLLADALSSLAEVRIQQRRLPEARILYERCLDLLDAEERARADAGLTGEAEHDRIFSSTSVRGTILEHLADVCRRLGDDAAAAQHAMAAWQLNDARPTTHAAVEGFILAADAELSENRLDEALGLYQHAVYLAEDEDPSLLVPGMLTRALNGLGRGCRQVGAARAALRCFDRARRLEERRGNAARLAHHHLGIARVLRDRPDLGGAAGISNAREHLERALTYASVPGTDHDDLGWTASDGTRYRIAAPDRAWPILLELGSLLQDNDDGPAAAHFLTIATRLADLVRAGVVGQQQRIAVQNQQIAAYAALTTVYADLARAGGPRRDEYAGAAWLATESMRARGFLDVLGDSHLAVPTLVPAELVERESALLARRRDLRRAGGTDLAFWAQYREVASELDAVWEQMRAAAPVAEGYVEVRQARPADPADLSGLLESTGDRPVVLASLVRLGDRLGVFAVRGDGAAPLIQTRPVDLPRLDRFVRQNFGSAGRVRELAVDMEDLFQHELAPVSELLAAVSDPADLLVVCPVGVLHHVPLGALRCGRQILLERNPVGLLPSGSLLRALRSAAHVPADVPAAVFGDPTGDLPGARAEALAVAARYGTAPALGPEASTAAVRRALTAAGVLHVAAHASFDPSDALGSGLRLADGLLTARDIISQQAPALSLVALSACETGLTETDSAEELIGLTRALLFAGADTIVVSLWKVPDLPTMSILGGFYDGIRDGQAKADALRSAVLAAREVHGPGRMDRWAGFQLIGDWR